MPFLSFEIVDIAVLSMIKFNCINGVYNNKTMEMA